MVDKHLDVLKLAYEVDRTSRSGEISRELRTQGMTLYGANPKYPGYLEQITPDGSRKLGHWVNGKFESEVELNGPSSD